MDFKLSGSYSYPSCMSKCFSVKHFLLRSLCLYSSISGLNFLSFGQFSQTFNQVCVDLVLLFFFAFSFIWSTTISSDEANWLSAINFCFLLLNFALQLYSFHNDFHIVLCNFHLHSKIYLCAHY